MAALQTLRNKPALLMSVIGGALLLFIVTLTDLNSCSNPNVMGEVDGQDITVQDFEQQVNDEINLESTLMMILTQGQVASISDARKAEIRQQLWEDYKTNKLLAVEAEKLGLSVTKEDVQNALTNVNMQQLQQKLQMMQYGQSSMANFTYPEKIIMVMGSVDAYKQFMKTADQQISQAQKQNPEQAAQIASLKQACLYCESQIPAQLLVQKYMTLVSFSGTTNPILAKKLAEEYSTICDINMVQIPYSTVAEKDIKITDEDLKAKYEEIKEAFRIYSPSRDLKVINVAVSASAKDQENIVAQVKAAEDSLRKAQTVKDVENVMRDAKTEVAYRNIYLPKTAYEQGLSVVANALDSVGVGSVVATKVEPVGQDGVQYVSTFKVVAMKNTPDSMQVCQFAVDSKAMADSIVAAVKGGSNLSAEAKKRTALVQKYGLSGDTAWINTNYYVDVTESDSAAAPNYVDVCQIPVGQTAYFTTANPQTGQPIYVVVSVLAAKAQSNKYNLAIVRTPIEFSNDTYTTKLNELRTFLSNNRSIEEIEKNAAKAGFMVENYPHFTTSSAMNSRMNIGGEGAKEAFIWAFDEAEAGQISPKVYECGRDNDHLLVVCVVDINEGDYLAWDNANVKKQLEALVRQDKQAEKIMAEAKKAKNIGEAKRIKGGVYSAQPNMHLTQLMNANPVFAGAIQRTEKGKFMEAVKGSNGVVLAQVNNKTIEGDHSSDFANMAQFSQFFLRQIFDQNNSFFGVLESRGNITDKRYKF